MVVDRQANFAFCCVQVCFYITDQMDKAGTTKTNEIIQSDSKKSCSHRPYFHLLKVSIMYTALDPSEGIL